MGVVREWIPSSITPAVHPAEYPTTAARQWNLASIPLSIPEQLASGSRRVSLVGGSWRVSGQYRARAARQYSPVDPASIPPSLVLLLVPARVLCRARGLLQMHNPGALPP